MHDLLVLWGHICFLFLGTDRASHAPDSNTRARNWRLRSNALSGTSQLRSLVFLHLSLSARISHAFSHLLCPNYLLPSSWDFWSAAHRCSRQQGLSCQLLIKNHCGFISRCTLFCHSLRHFIAGLDWKNHCHWRAWIRDTRWEFSRHISSGAVHQHRCWWHARPSIVPKEHGLWVWTVVWKHALQKAALVSERVYNK